MGKASGTCEMQLGTWLGNLVMIRNSEEAASDVNIIDLAYIINAYILAHACAHICASMQVFVHSHACAKITTYIGSQLTLELLFMTTINALFILTPNSHNSSDQLALLRSTRTSYSSFFW